MTGRELIAWLALAALVGAWTVVLVVLERRRRKPAHGPIKVLRPPDPARPRRSGRTRPAHRQAGPGAVPGGCPITICSPSAPWWPPRAGRCRCATGYATSPGVDAWSVAVRRFYARAGADPDVAGYFRGVDMDELQRHFLAAIMVVTGQGVTVGVVRRMRHAHAEVRNGAGERSPAPPGTR